MRRGAAVACAALLLAGCGTLGDMTPLANRLACTVAGDRGFIVSMWAFFGIATEIDKRDAKVICKAMPMDKHQ